MSYPIDRFNELADEYDEFTDAMPNYREMNETILEYFEVWFDRHSPETICELGCGTGTMTRTLVEEFGPDQYLALDGAGNMVEETIGRFADYSGPTHVQFEQTTFEEWDPDEQFDVVYSSLSIHHMSDSDKQSLYRTIRDSLNQPGLFLYVDLFSPPDSLADYYFDLNKTRRLELGMSEEEFQERWQSHLDNDRPSDWTRTMEWLSEAGFDTVDCGWKNGNRSLFLATQRQ